MSKSDASDYSRIHMTDDADAIALKLRKAKTDPQPLPGPEALDEKGYIKKEADEARPEAFNLLSIYAALSDRNLADVVNAFAGKEFSAFKKELTDLAVSVLGPIGSEMQRLLNQPGDIDRVLRQGAERAEAISEPILREVEDTIGFLRAK